VDDDVLVRGEWICTHEEFAGKAISAAELEKMNKTLIVSSDRFVIERSKDVGRGKYDGKVKLTATASPKEFDFYGDEPGGNKVWFYGVYELTADEFKICYFRATTPEDRSKRATDFRTRQGVPLVMNKFKRVASPRATAWVPLLNGKDLSGWEVDGKAYPWKVADGVLSCQEVAISRRGALLTKGAFTDFTCRFDFQTSSGGRAGVVLWALPGKKAVMVSLADDTKGDDVTARTGTLWWPDNSGGKGGTKPPDQPARLKPVGEWNTAVVHVRGTILQLTVNDEDVLKADLASLPDAKNTEALTRTSGRIGLQNHNDQVIRFRNIEVQEPVK